ncbi:DNA repair helicase-like protein, putative [Bodo saltans]|uniref:DNA 3'-5' helicase n=1 Tax=Bodo saltans TaxID=75058 RepID=A0A0S4JHE3_BODSA|nr:DNA repair helicase-like protein, putative [Bodo saltans]|eukprot:CUG88668.1 DNA repair helicase-like protein, putative [Bodo saltans]
MFLDRDGRLFVETFGEEYRENVRNFVLSCAEPVSRPEFVNEYAVTPASLAAASAEGSYTGEDVREFLLRRSEDCDARLPAAVDDMIAVEIMSEKISLTLAPDLRGDFDARSSGGASRSNLFSSGVAPSSGNLAYFLQCSQKPLLEAFANEVKEFLDPYLLGGERAFVISDLVVSDAPRSSGSLLRERRLNGSSGPVTKQMVYKCRIRAGCQRQIKEALYQRSIRVICTYDYMRDLQTPTVANFSLRLGVRLRPYQAASLERFRRDDKAHHGVVVLPCGAGKTLTGIAASSIVSKKTIVMCCNVLSVMQWRKEFLRWTDLREDQVTVCVRGMKQRPGDVFITTYSMLTAQRATRPADAVVTEDALLTKEILSDIANSTWGMLLLDEVHIAPAQRFQEVINCVKHHCVLGLSATLLREDQRIDNLRFLVGPKLYEANWLELTNQGFLADVVCVDVRCPMPPAYLRMYLDPQSTDESLCDISSVNPHKLWATQALLHFHGSRSPPDKTIIFCDSIPALQFYATQLCIPFMDGRTPEDERAKLLEYFKTSPNVNTIILSRVGDIALDIPEASVIIQLSGLGASRRQEAQRLGRILRPKPASVDSTTAYFYTLVSEDTDESRNAFGRQEWLRDQGFAYRMMSFRDILQHYAPNSKMFLDNGQGRAPSTMQPSNDCNRRRSRLLCVGPPKWYWLSDELESPEFVNATHSSDAENGRIGRWKLFSRAHSVAIDEAFQRGQLSLPLRVSHALPSSSQRGSAALTLRPGQLTLRVTFSSADAPITFGTVQCFSVAEGGSQQLVGERRIAKHLWNEPLGDTEEDHCCTDHDECLMWLLQRVGDAKQLHKRGRQD